MKRRDGDGVTTDHRSKALFVGLPTGEVYELFSAAVTAIPARKLQARGEDLSSFAAEAVGAVVIDGRRRTGSALQELTSAASDIAPAGKIILFVDAAADAKAVSDHPQLHAVFTPKIELQRLAWAIDEAQLLHDLLGTDANADPPCAKATDQIMVGSSRRMQEVFRKIRRFASSDAPVLITGESGTGKELAARALHERSAFADGPFVAINCGGIPGELIASELFGYEKGAFTGARETKRGRIETAANGTLFLDEIGDLPMALQTHLLRFLQDGAIERVGGLKTIHVPTRIVAGTNVDLDRAIDEGRFRADLFYRLNVLRLSLPPLRERDDDAVLIAQQLLRAMRQDHGKPRAALCPSAVAAIRAHTWPGNVRELISALRRGLTMCQRSRIRAEDLGIPRASELTPPSTLDRARADAERDAVVRALQHSGYRIRDAARSLDISHVTLYTLLKKHGLSPRYDGHAQPDGNRP